MKMVKQCLKLNGIRLRKYELFKLKNEYVLFCPCFDLDSTIKNNEKIPRWNDLVRAGLLVGRSPQRVGNIVLILNLSTGDASPKFKLVHNGYFETVKDLHNGIVPASWE